jgi:hypothetical protein
LKKRRGGTKESTADDALKWWGGNDRERGPEFVRGV